MKLSEKQRQVLDKFVAAPRAKQEAVINAFSELFGDLKAEWEARPQNQGKTVTYRELWAEFTGQVDEEDPLVQWDSQPPPGDTGASEIPHFDARGMQRVYGRGDHFHPHQSFHMDIWKGRDGRLLMRCWSRCADIDGRSYEIRGVDPGDVPLAGSGNISDDTWVPKAARLAYDAWVAEEL